MKYAKGGLHMYRGIKVRLLPTTEQEEQFRKSTGVARWSYNYTLSEKERVYREYLENNRTGNKSITEGTIRKYINKELKPTTHTWLKEVSNNVMKQAVKDADLAYKRWIQGVSSKPRYKSKHQSKMSFYVNYESLLRTPNGFRGEKLGIVKTSKPLPKLKKGDKYSNPRISYDGKHWYLSIGIKVEQQTYELTDKTLGIDLGIKDLAIVSNGRVYKNINKTKRVKQLEKRLKREQRKLSRKEQANIRGYESNRRPIYKKPLRECKNYQKQVGIVRGIHKKLTDLRQNHIHQSTSEIVKTKPSRIVMETLNIKGMLKNKHLSKALSQQKLYEFKRQIQYKCEYYGIEFIEADKWFPSSKLCSSCGNKKVDLKLSDRTYHCINCGLTIDRDYNASLNLSRYKI